MCVCVRVRVHVVKLQYIFMLLLMQVPKDRHGLSSGFYSLDSSTTISYNTLVCSLQELSASGRTLPCDSIFEQAVLQDFSAPVAFIFGGEVGQLLPDLVVHCDAGAFIPSWVRLGSQNGLPSDQIGHLAQSTAEDLEDATEKAEARSRTHSCNLCIAACIVLSERFRHRLASIKTCSARPQSQGTQSEKNICEKNRLWSDPRQADFPTSFLNKIKVCG